MNRGTEMSQKQGFLQWVPFFQVVVIRKEKRPVWPTIIPTVVASIAVVVAIIIYILSNPPVYNVNIEYVLDASENMNVVLGSDTKFDIAKRVLLTQELVPVRNQFNLALRVFGQLNSEECDTAKMVDFHKVRWFPKSGIELIWKRLNAVTPRGKANLSRAVTEAIADFADAERFPPGVHKRVILISAGLDTCEAQPVQRIRSFQSQFADDVELDLRLIGFDVDQSAREQLKEIVELFPEGKYYDAENETELKYALLALRIDSISLGLERVQSKLNDVVTYVKREDYDQAQEQLTEAENQFEQTLPLFYEVESWTYEKEGGEQAYFVSKIFERIREMRSIHYDFMRINNAILERSKAYGLTDREVANLMRDYNNKAQRFNELRQEVTELLEQVFELGE